MILQKFIMMGLLLMPTTVNQFSSARQLIIFGKEENQLLVQQQLQMLGELTDAVKERAIKITVLEKHSPLYSKHQVKHGQFTIILIGKDGTEKYRSNKLLQPKELFAVIDAMPMRRAEMRKKKRN